MDWERLETRKARLIVRMTPTEMQEIRETAKRMKLPISIWVRRVLEKGILGGWG